MDVLLVAFGSAGDVFPLVGLGAALRGRGHRVTALMPAAFQPSARAAGLGFAALPRRERVKAEPAGGPARRALAAVLRQFRPERLPGVRRWRKLARPSTLLPMLRPVYDFIARHHVPGRTVVVAVGAALGARVARDRLPVRLVTAHLAPAHLRSARQPPRVPPLAPPRWAPPWAARAAYRLADALILDPTLAGPVNALRAELGLPPVRRVLDGWRHSPDGVLGLFPDWFAPPQPDWPPGTRLAGFPLHDDAGRVGVPAWVEAFLAGGEPPLVFTPGSAAHDERRFFAESAEACRRLGRRALFLTRFRDQLPARLPEGVRHVDYLPFSRVLPRAAALVHHGGVGTASQALAAAVPQVVAPAKHDQWDNAERLARLGVARVLPPRRYRAEAVAPALAGLLGSPEVTRRCQELSWQVDGARALAAACEAVEGLGGAQAA
jgi:UDP:flavonoid glycosyltransferase YjiC (YdhE family)